MPESSGLLRHASDHFLFLQVTGPLQSLQADNCYHWYLLSRFLLLTASSAGSASELKAFSVIPVGVQEGADTSAVGQASRAAQGCLPLTPLQSDCSPHCSPQSSSG